MTKPQITLPQITFRELLRPPAKSSDGQATMYLDRTTSTLLISVDGYEYVPLGTGSLSVGTTTVGLATNEICTFTSFELAGGGNLPVGIYNVESVGSVSRAGIIQSVQIYNSTADTVIATHSHPDVATTVESTEVLLLVPSIIEVRHKLIGTLIDGDFGQLVSVMVSRS